MNKKDKISGSRIIPTGVYCTPLEMEGLLEIIKEVDKTSIILVKGTPDGATVIPKQPKTQQDIFKYVRKLAEKHKLPEGFYAVNSKGELLLVVDANEPLIHEVYNVN